MASSTDISASKLTYAFLSIAAQAFKVMNLSIFGTQHIIVNMGDMSVIGVWMVSHGPDMHC